MTQVDSKTLVLSNRATVFLALMMVVVLALISATGCKQEFSESLWIPAPLSKVPPPYEVKGNVHYSWGDSLKIGRVNDEVHELHQCILIGVDTPKPGQRFHRNARRASLDLFQHKAVRFDVTRVNEFKFECGFMFVDREGEEPIDIGLKMIELGFAWYDGEDFERSDLYVQAEQKAREQKLGLWADKNPIPPWEFYEKQQAALKKRLSGAARADASNAQN